MITSLPEDVAAEVLRLERKREFSNRVTGAGDTLGSAPWTTPFVARGGPTPTRDSLLTARHDPLTARHDPLASIVTGLLGKRVADSVVLLVSRPGR
ncbi:MAG: hypothetical protein ACRDVG_00460 [Jatrophihabitantaceae bacterium]